MYNTIWSIWKAVYHKTAKSTRKFPSQNQNIFSSGFVHNASPSSSSIHVLQRFFEKATLLQSRSWWRFLLIWSFLTHYMFERHQQNSQAYNVGLSGYVREQILAINGLTHGDNLKLFLSHLGEVLRYYSQLPHVNWEESENNHMPDHQTSILCWWPWASELNFVVTAIFPIYQTKKSY